MTSPAGEPVGDPRRMHVFDAAAEALAAEIVAYALDRLRMDPPLDSPLSPDELRAAVGATVTPGGIGGPEAMRLWAEVLGPTCISQDHRRALSFVPCAPTDAAQIFDLVVGASAIYGGSWLEGSGAVEAENQALRWVADLAGLPAGGRRVLRGGRDGGQPLRARRGPRHARRADAPPRVVTGPPGGSSPPRPRCTRRWPPPPP